MTEKAGQVVAHFQTMVMITKGKTTALTGLPVDEELFKSENKIEDQAILDLLAQSMEKKEQKKNKEKK